MILRETFKLLKMKIKTWKMRDN